MGKKDNKRLLIIPLDQHISILDSGLYSTSHAQPTICCTTMSLLGYGQEDTETFFLFLEFTFETTPCSFTIQILKVDSSHAPKITLISY